MAIKLNPDGSLRTSKARKAGLRHAAASMNRGPRVNQLDSLDKTTLDKLSALPETDAGNAEAFEVLYGDRFRYDHKRGKWLVWTGKYWCLDETGGADRAVLTTVRARQRAALNISDTKMKEEQLKWTIWSESTHGRRATLTSAQTLSKLATRTTEYDREPFLLTVRNGTLDLASGKLREFCPFDLITRATKINYSPSARCLRWMRFLEEIFDGDRKLIDFVQRAMGYSLTGDVREQCLFLLVGGGANGKTVFQEIICELIGTHATTAPFSTFLRQRNSGAPRNDVAKLCGARLVKASESPQDGALDEATIKALTGEDTICARFLYQEHFEFRPTFKLWLATNHRPEIRGTDDAIWRRIKLVEFPRQFLGKNSDRQLLSKLRTELPGILAWAVRGCQKWQRSGLGNPPAIEEATTAYRQESDQVGRFLKEACHMGRRFETPARDLYDHYAKWCDNRKEISTSNNEFAKALVQHGLKKKRGNTGVRYIGVSLRRGAAMIPTSGRSA